MTVLSNTKTSSNNYFDWILVDGSSYLFRAYHAMPEFSNSKGDPTGAVYGIVNMLKKLINQYDYQYLAIIFDAPGKTFRSEIYEDYKANRPPMPDDLRQQIHWVHEIVKANGWPMTCISGVEADDVIGTLSVKAGNEKQSVLISSGDKDLAQLVNDHVVMIDSMKNAVYDEAKVIEKFGVKPNQIIDYLALVGDASDNIPGVQSVGPKTAAKWLAEYETVDNIIANADKIKGKVGEKLRDSFEVLKLSKDLATIRCDVELNLKTDDFIQQQANKDALKEIYTQLEFSSWIQMLEKPASTGSAQATSTGSAQVTSTGSAQVTSTGSAQATSKDNADKNSTNVDQAVQADNAAAGNFKRQPFDIINSPQKFKQWQDILTMSDTFAIDTETTSLNAYQAELVGVSFAVAGKSAYLPLQHGIHNIQQQDTLGDVENDKNNDEAKAISQQLPMAEVLDFLKKLLACKKHTKIWHNAKYDMAVLGNLGIEVAMPFEDTMIMSYVINSTSSRHDLDTLALANFNHKMISYTEVAGKGKAQILFSEVDIETAADYASEDAELTLALYEKLKSQLSDDLEKVYYNIDLPLVKVLETIERNGIKLDVQRLHQLTADFEKTLLKVEQDIHQEAGQEFNISSPKQIQHILYDTMGIPVRKKTPTGQPSTSEDVLQDLAEEFSLPAKILQYRSLSKLISTYTKKLPEAADEKLRVHSSFHQAIAITGRLSSSDPNLQNIPIRSEEGRKIRTAFVAEANQRLIAADYSQIELRIMAHLSQDKSLLDAFNDDQDIHKRTAAELFNVPSEAVSFEQRRFSKAINFGLIYGMSAFGLAKQLGIGREEAQGYIDLYFERYPGVKRFMDEMRIKAAEQGYVETIFGRRLYLPEINSKNYNRRQYAERTAINAPMQGTAADLIKQAMVLLHEKIRHETLPMKMILQVHDELIFEVPEADVDNMKPIIEDIMQNVAQLSIPLKVDIGVGENWEQAH